MAGFIAPGISNRSRSRLIAGCGVVIIILGAGSALLPIVDPGAAAKIVAALLFAAGLIELLAGIIHQQAKGLSMLAGAVTTGAGLLFVFNSLDHFFPTAFLVTAWLIMRSIILLLAGIYSTGSVRIWTLFAAAMDFLLAILLLIGLSVSALVVALFGPTTEVVARFAWILALSFAVTGAMLLEIASCQRQSAD